VTNAECEVVVATSGSVDKSEVLDVALRRQFEWACVIYTSIDGFVGKEL